MNNFLNLLQIYDFILIPPNKKQNKFVLNRIFNIYKQIIFCFHLIIYIKANTTSAPPRHPVAVLAPMSTSAPPRHPVSGSGIHEHQRTTSAPCRGSGCDEHHHQQRGTSSGCQQQHHHRPPMAGSSSAPAAAVLGDDLSQRTTSATSSGDPAPIQEGRRHICSKTGGRGRGCPTTEAAVEGENGTVFSRWLL